MVVSGLTHLCFKVYVVKGWVGLVKVILSPPYVFLDRVLGEESLV